MTSIVYKAPWLIADTRITWGNGRVTLGNSVKVYRVTDPECYVALAGDGGTERAILDVVKAAFKDKPDNAEISKFISLARANKPSNETSDLDGIVVVPQRTIFGNKSIVTSCLTYNIESCLDFTLFSANYAAFGSGASVALGALAAYGNPWRALDVATRLDNYTGYPLAGYNVNTGEFKQVTEYDQILMGETRPCSPGMSFLDLPQ